MSDEIRNAALNARMVEANIGDMLAQEAARKREAREREARAQQQKRDPERAERAAYQRATDARADGNLRAARSREALAEQNPTPQQVMDARAAIEERRAERQNGGGDARDAIEQRDRDGLAAIERLERRQADRQSGALLDAEYRPPRAQVQVQEQGRGWER